MDESNSEPSKSSKPVKKPMLTPNTLQKMADPTLNHIMPSRIDYQKAREEMGPPPPKPKKRAVLDEDTYEEIVKKTIERDYFPDAELFRLKDMYEEAARNKNLTLMEELKGKIQALEAGESEDQSKYYTIADVDNKEVKIPKNIPLNALGSMIVSEDTNSFNELQEKEQEERRKKLSMMYGHTNTGSSMLLEDEHHLLLTNGQTFRSFNSLMFTPSIEDSPQVSNVLMIKDKKRSLSERIGKKKPRIVPENTRISEEEEIFKVPKKEEEEVPTDPSSEQKESYSIHDSRHYLNQIPATPAPESIMHTPMMTWGDVASTPQILDRMNDHDKQKSDWWTKKKGFNIQPKKEKEEIADRLLKKMKAMPGSTLRQTKPTTPLVTPLQSPGYLKLKQMSQNRNSSIFFHQGSSLLNQSYKSPFISKTPSKANGNVSALRSSQVKKPPTSTTKQTKNPQSTSGITDGLL